MNLELRRVKEETLNDNMSLVCNILKDKGYVVSISRLDKEFPERLAVLQYDTTILQQDDGNVFYYMGLHNSVNVKCVVIPENDPEYIIYMKRHPEVIIDDYKSVDNTRKSLIRIINPFSRISIDFRENYNFESLPKGFDMLLEKDKLGNDLYSLSTTVYYEFDSPKNDIYAKLNLMLGELIKWASDLHVRDGYVVPQEVVEIDFNKKKFEEMVYKKAYKLYGKDLPSEVDSRIKKELEALLYSDRYKDGKDSYKIYKYVAKFVRELKKNNVVVSYRGYLGSSLVCYLLGIHDINPLSAHYDIPNYGFYGLGSEKIPEFEFTISSKDRLKAIDLYKNIFKDLEDRLETDNSNLFKTTIHVDFSSVNFYLLFIDYMNDLSSAEQKKLSAGKYDLNDSNVYEYLNNESGDVLTFFKDVLDLNYNLFQKLNVKNFNEFTYAVGILKSKSNHSKIMNLLEDGSLDIASQIYCREAFTQYLLDIDGSYDTSDCYLTMDMDLFEHVQFVNRFKGEIDAWAVEFISNTASMFPKAHIISYALIYYLLIYNKVYDSK